MPTTPAPLIGESPLFLDLLDQVSHLAQVDRPVLVIGERGTGKELIAQRLHYLSSRWDHSYIQVSCAALPGDLLDSALFGHESGAFTGANRQHHGYFEQADEGTLLLDELATASASVQEKMLRVIEYGTFHRIGGQKTLTTNVRIIGSTNVDLPNLADQGLFRKDLLDRLSFDVITIPPLRARADDILLLARQFAVTMCQTLGRSSFPGFSKEVKDQLLNYHWPGNVRELKNVIERSVYRHGSSGQPLEKIIIDPFESPWRPGTSEPQHDKKIIATPRELGESNPDIKSEPIDLKQHLQDYEKNLIMKALSQNKGSQTRTAKFLGLTYHQFRGILRKYHLLKADQEHES